MPYKNIHLTNANNLTHHWDPTSTEETLTIDKDTIKIEPNTKRFGNWPRALHTAATAIRELEIITIHCKAMIQLGDKVNTEIQALPSTNITEYHEKISAYQGMINLLFNHLDFLRNVSTTLKSKFQIESTPFISSISSEEVIHSFFNPLLNNTNHTLASELEEELVLAHSCKKLLNKFEFAQNQNDEVLESFQNRLKDFRYTQKQNAMPHQNLIIFSYELSSGHLFTQITAPVAPQEFTIGKYTHQDKNYNILASMVNNHNFYSFLTKNPLESLCFKSMYSNSSKIKASIEITVTWALKDYPILYPKKKDQLEPTAAKINYLDLFISKKPQIPFVEPTLMIKKITRTTDHSQHVYRLFQAVAEWMEFYQFDKIIAYGVKANALYYHSFGFSTANNHLSTITQDKLAAYLERGTFPSFESSESSDNEAPLCSIPFTLRKDELQTAMLYNFKSRTTTTYAKLIHENPVLTPKILPSQHPKIAGSSFLPYKNTLSTLLQREIGQIPKRSSTQVRAVPVDYHDILNPSERMACAQVGLEELKQARVPLAKGTLLKVKRF